ncbi:MAG: hypothetical protein U1E49_11000 [Hyphomicrobiaceae bacterium]
MSIRPLLLAAVACLVWALPAHADQMAFAAVQAPEQGYYTCHAANIDEAMRCATKKCTEDKSTDCAVMAACASGWSGSMGVMLEEVHFTDTVCGAPSKPAVIQALTAFCRGRLPHVKECFISEVWTPQGKSEKVEKTLTAEQLVKKKN